MLKRALPGFVCLLLLLPSFAHSWQGKVVGITDGDIISVLHDGKEEKVRLFGIDCPEIQQDFGQEAKKLTSSMVSGRIVDVEPRYTDSYGRTVGLVSTGGKVVNEELVRAGLAWVYTKYCKDSFCGEWKRLQENAVKKQIGLWYASDAMPPWDFRQARSTRAPASRDDPALSRTGARKPDYYHGDTVTHVFHSPGCKDYDCPTCIVPFKTRDEAIRARYRPCVTCGP